MITIGTTKNVSDRERDLDITPKINTQGAYGYKSIIEGLDKIKKKYDDTVHLNAKEYADSAIREREYETDDELLAKARDELSDSYLAKKEKAATKRDATIRNANAEKRSLDDSYIASNESLGKAHEKELRSHEEKMAKRGLTHSSQNELEKARIDREYRSDVAKLGSGYAYKVRALTDRLENAEKAYDEALRSYDISYAIDLEKKMDKYKAQRDKLLAAYEASDEKLRASKEQEYLDNYEVMNREYEKAYSDYVGDKQANYLERFDYVSAEMDKMSDVQRKRFVSLYGEELSGYLGLYYDRLLREKGV